MKHSLSQYPIVPAFQLPSFLLTIDVEDWFQVENFKTAIPFSSWDAMELRVENNTNRLLDLFDGISSDLSHISCDLSFVECPPSTGSPSLSPTAQDPDCGPAPRLTDVSPFATIHATFFVLGWIAERLPGLVREIKHRGHEVASHGYHHHLCSEQNAEDLRTDLTESKKRLEDIIGAEVSGYRAPSFSVNNDIMTLIEDAGYGYDASYNSFDRHGRYGKLSTGGFRQKGIAYQISNFFYELPVSNLYIRNFVLPWGGGGYFRLMPSMIFNMGIQPVLRKYGAYHFYMHPWEIDSSQPRVDRVPTFFKFRHYVNLQKTEAKLKKMIRKFRHCRFSTCKEYLDMICN